MSYIEIKQLTYYYPKDQKPVLRDINLQLDKGKILFVVGESGSGKSTLAKCISGAVPNFYGGTIQGSVDINGQGIIEMEHNKRSREVTMVFQDPESQLIMNKVDREIAFGLENVGVESSEIKRRIWEAMEFSNILDIANREINTLSGGQKQRVAITSAMVYLPNCIILDEPTSQLDPAAAEDVIALIKKINDELGITIIIIEQRIHKWFDIADEILVLSKGKIAFLGNKQEFYNQENDALQDFLPSYLKISKALDIVNMPCGLKDIRRTIEASTDEYKTPLLEKVLSSKEEIIKIENLCCKYEDILAIKDLNLSIKQGEFISILGANGGGKSTFLKSLMGLINYSGSIKVLKKSFAWGEDSKKLSKNNIMSFSGEYKEIKKLKIKDIAKIIGYVSQNPNDYISKETVYEELKFTLDNYNIKDNGVIEETLKALDIYKLMDKNPRDLSGGEIQRVAIASILVLKPKILLLDEPTRGLDGKVKKMLGEILLQLNKNGTSIILITHDVDFASEFCSRFLLMFNGEIVGDGNREEVLGSGIYYTTTINKIFRNRNTSIFTLKDFIASKSLAPLNKLMTPLNNKNLKVK
ncbi:ATP-binding cassette domain-containing protein [Clostridium estertheticum]|uniref:ABC transporter ATP-binding protein n=1 Tax=Clostridium estertheticum TaxID=238834 RepID=UPI0013E90188|nr:energy-coupling factor transporter ATPase [Clostridium estertheticum]MBZ9688413.1 ATP-binding cassette domain-containing protein [Clostridium estertheticum]